MIVSRTVSVVLVSVATALVIACGGADSNQGATFKSGNGDDEGANGSGNVGDEAVFGGDGTGTGNGTTAGSGTTSGTSGPKCAAVNVKAQQIPVYLVFMFDKSGSMNQQSKWTSCSAGLKSFFADGKSAGMSASIQFFPLGDTTTMCGTPQYQAPNVDMRALPNGTDFKTAIEKILPDGNTPTLPALQGALAYAKQIRATKAAQDQGKVAVVLVTDGSPVGCDGNTVQAVANAAAAAKAEVSTFVIGVGNVAALDTIAQAGGTQKAYIVSTNNPGQTATEFNNALATIRGSQLSCEYKMPEAPAGKTLDLATVNVVYTSGAGKADTLAYSKDCAGPGWRYDNPSAPSKIELCPATCTAVKTDASPKVDIELGCATKGTDGTGIPR